MNKTRLKALHGIWTFSPLPEDHFQGLDYLYPGLYRAKPETWHDAVLPFQLITNFIHYGGSANDRSALQA